MREMRVMRVGISESLEEEVVAYPQEYLINAGDIECQKWRNGQLDLALCGAVVGLRRSIYQAVTTRRRRGLA